jgi:type IX secretion system PorP/SprF family membrane protein
VIQLFKGFLQRFDVLVLVVLCSGLTAQDAHFTQFYNVPAYANPALTGNGNSRYRVSSIYRDQYRSALEKPITSFAVGGDLKFDMGGDYNLPDNIGIGLMFYNDNVNALDFSTNQLSISGSYHKLLDKRTQQFIGFGVQTSVQQKAINYENIYFPDQFNSLDGYTLPTGEELPANNIGFFDLSLGFNYSAIVRNNYNVNVGLGIFHIMKPSVSFYNRDDILNRRLSVTDFLNRRFVLHGSMKTKLQENISTEARLVLNKQGPYQEINFSNLFHVKNLDFDHRGFFFGPGARVANVQSAGPLRLESLNLTAGIEYNQMVFSLSYDHSLAPLLNDRRGFNGIEFSFIFFGDFTNDVNICPKF